MAYLGFNFRATAGFVTDGTGESAVTDVDFTDYTYPYTSFGNGVTAGYVGGSNAMRSRNRNSGVDRRCAGLHYDNVTTAQQYWRVDMSSSGDKNVVISIGDNSYGTADDYLELFDDTTSLGVLVNDSNGHSAGQFYDANATLHTTAANWAANQTPILKTFSTTILKIRTGRGAGSAGNPGISHLAWDSVASASTSIGKPKRKGMYPGAIPFAFNRFSRAKKSYTATLGVITGTLASTNANDTMAASGTTTVTGALSKTNNNDTLSAAGTTTVAGTVAKTNANDTLNASGTTTVTGNLSTTNANDTLAASGTTTVTGSVAKTNANDTLAASGTTTVTGTLSTTNANDTLSASGSPVSSGSLAKTNANDTMAASGSVGDAVSGTLAKTNANDTVVSSGTTTVIGALSKTNNNDTLSASGSSTVNGTLAKTNANDSVVASGSIGNAVTGTLVKTNANDSIVASGTTTITGTLAKTNNSDSMVGVGTTSLVGLVAVLNANDLATAMGFTTITGSIAYTNANDTLYTNPGVLENFNLTTPIYTGASLSTRMDTGLSLSTPI